MYRIFIFLCFISITSPALADLRQQNSYDLGIALAPSMSPESGYSQTKFRFGLEIGMCFFKFEDESEGSSTHTTTFKLIKIGIASIANQPALIFSPISILLKDKVYFSPTFGFGRSPYTLFSLSYELLP